jgi:ATP-dependent exoDNAse (exonuclease V) alpha subunit
MCGLRCTPCGPTRIRNSRGSGRTVDFNFRQHPHLDYGYARTSHSSQGQTADRVIVHVSSIPAFAGMTVDALRE